MKEDLGNRPAFLGWGTLRRIFRVAGTIPYPSIASAISFLLALFAFAGWVLAVPRLQNVLPGTASMKPNASLGLMLAATALFLLSRRPSELQERWAQLIAISVAALGLATLSQFFFGWNLKIDQLLFQASDTLYTSYPGRMSQLTAAALILVGSALAIQPYSSLRPVLRVFSTSVALLGAISLLGYMWDVSDLITSRWLDPMPVNAALCLVLLGTGTFTSSRRPDQIKLMPTLFVKRTLFGFLGTLLTLVLAGGYIYQLAAKYEHSASWVRHTVEVRAQLGQLHRTISTVDSLQRGYLLTGKPAYKLEYQAGVAKFGQQAREVAGLLADNPRQLENLRLLQSLVGDYLAVIDRELSDYEQGGGAVLRRAIFFEDGIEAMQDIRGQVERMLDTELQLHAQREASLEHNRQQMLLALLVTLGVIISILTAQFLWIRRESIKRRQVEAELRDEAARLSAIFESVAEGIVTIDEVGTVESFNPAAERIFGYSAEEVIGQNIKKLMPEPYRGEHDGYLENYRSTRQAHVIGNTREVAGLRKDGSTLPLSLSVSEMLLGNQAHFTGIMQDISDRKRAEAELRDSEARLRRMLETSPIGVRILRLSDNRRIFSNKAYGEIFHTSQEALLVADPSLYYQDPQEYLEICRQLEQGQDVINRKIGILGADGEKAWVMSSYIRIEYEGEAADLAWFYDVTPIHHAQEQAEHANRLKSDFLSTMSHEIRTPLTGLLGMLEVLSLSPLEPEQKSTLNAAWASARGLLRIVNDILDWSKIEEGKLHLAPQSTSLPLLLADVINTYSRMASSKSLDLRYLADDRLSRAHIVDPLRLSQILNNFVSNAVKFTSQGEVELRAELLEQVESSERIRFSVRDTGAGIPKNVQAQLFNRYQQASAETARMYGGTGLGLAICQRLAEMMDGQLDLESEPGRGSTFSITLTLPVSAEVAKLLHSEHPEVEQRSVTPLFSNVEDAPIALAVDDHPTNRDLLVNQLRLLGLRAETAENGQKALALWREGNYAIVITDCHMPEMDGYALALEIRRIEQIRGSGRIPIVAWTANILPEESEKCRAAGMDRLLVKPTSMAQLKHALAACLSMSEENIPDSQSAAIPGNTPIDYTVLDQVVPEHFAQKRVLNDFRGHIHADYRTLLQQLEQQDLAGIERTAHRMKGSSGMVGAHEVAGACQAIELAAHAGNNAQALSSRQPLESALARLDAYLAEISAAAGGGDEGVANANE